jgi:hypothetical protein
MEIPQDYVDNGRIAVKSASRSSVDADGNTTYSDEVILTEVHTDHLIFDMPLGHITEDNPIKLTLQSMRTPRSFRPSGGFDVRSATVEEYIIDAGGSDMTVVMSVMNEIQQVAVEPVSLVNGAITDYIFTLDSFLYIDDGDILNIEMPAEIGVPSRVSCKPTDPQAGVSDVSCESNGQSLYIQLNTVTQQSG